MLPRSDDKTLRDGPHTLSNAAIFRQRISRRALAKLGIGAFVAASVVAGMGGPARASGDNPPADLLAKIHIQATNKTITLSRARAERGKRPQAVGKSK
jgi:hypothetical protein